jgi:glycosyltransferase involved in cell wall biosynthesis
MCSEASYLNSGFSGYAKQILRRLHATNKYIIGEFASYARMHDPRDQDVPWIFYPNAPSNNDDASAKEYNANPENQFGRWRFERVVIDFKPDIIFDIRDYWMNSYQQNSPLRPYYHWVVMPTVDSEPQQEDWIDTYVSADGILTYSDFGRDVLLKQSNNKIKYFDTASPGVDLLNFRPMIEQKSQIRELLGMPKDAFVIGSVMRNQKRKLIPDLFDAIRILKEKNPELYNKTFLYLHTSYPDAGWDIPQLLKDYDITNKVFFTYYCPKCGNIRALLFSHSKIMCNKCGSDTLAFPNVNNGISTQNLALIYNSFDLYVQYAICEGFGMPQVEATACGIPIATVNYSAMQDIVQNLKAYPVKIQKYFKELETKAIRVYPDNDNLVEIMEKFYKLPDLLKLQKRTETRSLTEKHYNWDNIAKKWEKYFDNAVLTGLQGKWDHSLPTYTPIPEEIIESKIDNYTFVYGTIKKFLPNHPIISSIIPLNMIRDLDYGFVQHGMSIVPYTKKNVVTILNSIINNHNLAQNALKNADKLVYPDFIQYSRLKQQTKVNS